MDVKFTVECVDAKALLYALQKQKSASGYGLTNAFVEDDSLFFTVERYAMNALGSHVGTERLTGKLALYEAKDLGVSHLPWSPLVAIPAAMEVEEIEPAEEPREYTVVDAYEFLKVYYGDEYYKVITEMDGNQAMDEAYNLGLGAGDYFPPDEWFAHDELERGLGQALADLPSWTFHWDKDSALTGRCWTLGWDDDTKYTHRIGDEIK